MNNFITFLKKLDITKMTIGLIISTALSNLVTVLIEELINPWIPDFIVPKNKKIHLFGREINLSAIIGKVVGVIASLFFAFVIWKILTPNVSVSELT
mgnify:CR=1 FL=1